MITDEQTKELAKDQIYQWVAAKAVVIKDGKILMGKRLDETDYGLFELPGGKMERGETIEECFKREVLEETGLEVQPINLTGSEGQPVFIGQTDSKSVTFVYFLARILNDEKIHKENDELSDIGYYSAGEVEKFLENNLSRRCERTLLQKFVEGELIR